MTAAELLRNAAPPADDGVIDKAIAELDVRIFEWVDALKSAQTQLRSALAPVKPMRPSARLFEDTSPPSALSSGLSAAAAAAHIPSPPPMPAEWTTPPPIPPTLNTSGAPSAPAANAPGMPAEMPWPSQPSQFGGHGASTTANTPSQAQSWPEPPSFRQSEGGASSTASTGVMQWPSQGGNAWPNPGAAGQGGQGGGGAPQSLEWPTWSPTDSSASSSTSAKKGAQPAAQAPAQGPAAKKAAKGPKAAPEGPSPEERAQKAAAEEALLSELEDAIARRVRLLRRLDPDTPIEKLIDKARQGQAEASSGPAAREDKSSSWWRRK